MGRILQLRHPVHLLIVLSISIPHSLRS